MTWLISSYASLLVAFVAVDAVWLYTMGSALYRPTLGDILLETPRIAPAIVFYVVYPIGLLAFAVVPAVRAATIGTGGIGTAIASGALFGALAYATYDLTNFATLRNWTLQITLTDIAWGAALSAVAAGVGYGTAVGSRRWIG